jgi:hypothetical protein
VALLNQERTNNRVYVSLMEGRATYYSDDKILASLPASMLKCCKRSTPSAGR